MNSKKFLSALFFACLCRVTIFAQDGGGRNFSFNDTLSKYRGLDTLIRTEPSFYVGTINAKSFGIIQLLDTTIIIFQRGKTHWFISHSLKLSDIAKVNYSDLNGDNYKDIVITKDYTGAGGNSENVVLIYHPKTGLFKHNQSYDLPNIQYDKTKNLIYSAWWASANHPQDKMVYKISSDRLLFYRGVTYVPDERTQGSNGTVEFYTETKNKRIVTNNERQSRKDVSCFYQSILGHNRPMTKKHSRQQEYCQ